MKKREWEDVRYEEVHGGGSLGRKLPPGGAKARETASSDRKEKVSH